jgi:hypothetical protein
MRRTEGWRVDEWVEFTNESFCFIVLQWLSRKQKRAMKKKGKAPKRRRTSRDAQGQQQEEGEVEGEGEGDDGVNLAADFEGVRVRRGTAVVMIQTDAVCAWPLCVCVPPMSLLSMWGVMRSRKRWMSGRM